MGHELGQYSWHDSTSLPVDECVDHGGDSGGRGTSQDSGGGRDVDQLRYEQLRSEEAEVRVPKCRTELGARKASYVKE